MASENVESIRKQIDESGNYRNNQGDLYKSVGSLNDAERRNLEKATFYATEQDAQSGQNAVTINFENVAEGNFFTDERGRVYSTNGDDATAIGWVDKATAEKINASNKENLQGVTIKDPTNNNGFSAGESAKIGGDGGIKPEQLETKLSAGDSAKVGRDGGAKSSDLKPYQASDYIKNTYDINSIDSSTIIKDADGTIKGYTTKDGTRVIVDPKDQDDFTKYYNDARNEFKNNTLVKVQKVANSSNTRLSAGDSTIVGGDGGIKADQLSLSNDAATTRNVLTSTGATVVNIGTSLVEGVGEFGENIIKAGNIAVSGVLSPVAALDDFIKGNSGDQSALNQLWSSTKATVENNYVQSAFDNFYENNDAGKWIKNNSYGFDTTRKITGGVGKIAGVVGAAAVTGGGSLAVEPIAAIMGVSEFASGTGKAWNNGASTMTGLSAGAVNGVISGGLTYMGGSVAASTTLSPVQKVITNSAGGAVKGFTDPFITSMGNDNTTYMNEFNKLGGMKNVGINAAIAGGATAIGEGITAARTSYQPYDADAIGIEGGIEGNPSASKVINAEGPVNDLGIKRIEVVRETTPNTNSGSISSRNSLGIEGGIDSNAPAGRVIQSSGPAEAYKQVGQPSTVDAEVVGGRAYDSGSVTTNLGNEVNINELGNNIINETKNVLENQELMGN